MFGIRWQDVEFLDAEFINHIGEELNGVAGRIVDRYDARLDAGGAQKLHAAQCRGMRSLAFEVDADLIVNLGWPVDADAGQNFVGLEDLGPFAIDQDRIVVTPR